MPEARVLSVNVSRGGVPKLPVERAQVTRLGVEGDRQSEATVHGGPHRAVCLFGIEAIDRLRAEGHPVRPGSVGENITTQGVDWSLLPIGTRVRVGDALLLEVASPTMPCDTQRPNFRDGRFSRISIVLHPSDSRMYARVLQEGEVRTGDPVELLPPAEESRALTHRLLDRLDRTEAESNLRLWKAARAAGRDVRIVDDGELAIAAAPDMPGPAFNEANGLRNLPHMLPRALRHFRRAGVIGWLPFDEPLPWPEATPDYHLAISSATPGDIASADSPYGVTIRRLGAVDWAAWVDVLVDALGVDDPEERLRWADPAPHLLAARDVHVVVAEEAGGGIAVGSLHVYKRVGLLRAGMVRESERGRGLQRALIAARARLASELGCDVVTAQAAPESVSDRNLLAMGMRRVVVRPVYRSDAAPT